MINNEGANKIYTIQIGGVEVAKEKMDELVKKVGELTKQVADLNAQKLEFSGASETDKLKSVNAELKNTEQQLKNANLELRNQKLELDNILKLEKMRAEQDKETARIEKEQAAEKARIANEAAIQKGKEIEAQKEQIALQEAQRKGIAFTAEAYGELQAEIKAASAATGVLNEHVRQVKSGSVGLGVSGDRATRIKKISEEADALNSLSHRTEEQQKRLMMLETEYAKLNVTQREALSVNKAIKQEVMAQEQPLKNWILQVQNAASEWGQLGRMFFRFAAFTVVFDSMNKAIETITQSFKDWYNATHAEEEALHSLIEEYNSIRVNAHVSSQVGLTEAFGLGEVAKNQQLSLEERKQAVRELQSQYPTTFGLLKEEAILAGNTAKAYAELQYQKGKSYQYETAKGQYSATLKRVDEYENALQNGTKTEHPLWESLANAHPAMGALTNHEDFVTVNVNGKDVTITQLKQMLRDTKKVAEEQQAWMIQKAATGGIESTKKDKAPHDYFNNILQSKLKEIRYRDDAKMRLDSGTASDARLIIDDNRYSIDKRIEALKTYYAAEAKVAKDAYDKEIDQVDYKLKKIAELEVKARKEKLTASEQNLVNEKKALIEQSNDKAATYVEAQKKLAYKVYHEGKALKNTFVKDEMDLIDENYSDKESQISSSYLDKMLAALKGKGGLGTKKQRIETLKDKMDIAISKNTIKSNSAKIKELTTEGTNHPELVAENEKRIIALKQSTIDENIKIAEKEAKIEQDKQKKVQETYNLAEQGIRTYTDAYIEAANRRMDYAIRTAEIEMQVQHKIQSVQAHSQMQQIQQEKQYAQQQKELEKQKAEQQKKAAMVQLEINLALALSKMLVSALNSPESYLSGGVLGLSQAAIGDALIMANYATQMAVLNSAPAYAIGTNSAAPGLKRVNEQGGEIMISPGGETIIPHADSKRIMQFGYPYTGQNYGIPKYVSDHFSKSAGSNNDMSAVHAVIAKNNQQIGEMARIITNMQVSLNVNNVTAMQYGISKKVQVTSIGG